MLLGMRGEMGGWRRVVTMVAGGEEGADGVSIGAVEAARGREELSRLSAVAAHVDERFVACEGVPAPCQISGIDGNQRGCHGHHGHRVSTGEGHPSWKTARLQGNNTSWTGANVCG